MMTKFILEEYITGLEQISDTGYMTYYSKGAKERAYSLSKYAENGFQYLNKYFKTENQMPLLVLDQEDWEKRLQVMYGAFNSDKGCLHFPADKINPFIEAMKPLYENCPEEYREKLKNIIGSDKAPFLKGLQIYFDSKVVHEMTHPSMKNMKIDFGQRWITEFFCDYVNYSFLQNQKQEYREYLEVQKLIPSILFEAALPYAEYQRLEDFDNFWEEDASGLKMLGSPLNLIWFYVKGMRGVIDLYELFGEDFISCAIESYVPTNDLLVKRIGAAHEGIGNWFKEWIKKNQ